MATSTGWLPSGFGRQVPLFAQSAVDWLGPQELRRASEHSDVMATNVRVQDIVPS
jgi:hypothetical protein